MSTNMTDAQREALESGRNRGWDHANYSENVTGEDADPLAGPSSLDIPGYIARDAVDFFKSGWEEGVRNYLEGLSSDGTPQDDD
ncbi:hypothetical protein [Streptomyces sp. MP131-18]|uniref:hypothetical protein n=1 Tax=Streptomyces sp. MP131-18 TaxID=1857892 RepID=UPI00097BE60F|nr:hypothetical protein [Streptomyces sp. MP131-18]ONK10397.1 hypothetical protein STBA_11190 [Streptomyces sp. MP131-18]